jgi:hypothetical protein
MTSVLASSGACKRGDPSAPPCGAVGATFLLLAKQDLTTSKLDEARRRGVEQQLPAMRDSLIVACTETSWSASVRSCLVSARDHLAFEACEQLLSDVQRRDLARAARGDDLSKPSK